MSERPSFSSADSRLLEQVFPGDGSVVHAMRAFDWSRTPVGAPPCWPTSLRIAVGICVASPSPAQLVWGADLTLFYNDAFIPCLGARHPSSLGRAAREAWGDAWPVLAPVIETVRKTGRPGVAENVLVSAPSMPVREAYLSVGCSPVRGEDGRIEGVFCVGTDTTEMQRQLAVARSEALSASRAKDEFIAMLGHELRNPLSPIVTALHLMRMRGNEARELAVIERQVGHLVRLVDDLLDVSRITRGKIELRRERLEISQVVMRGLEMASPLLEQRHQRLDIQVPAAGLCVDGDPNRLAQVVANLVSNASKYSDHGSSIHIVGEAAGPMVRLSVRDEGVGISTEMLGRVFDMFVQQPQTIDRSIGGLGLGLAIVRNLVDLHGGSVTAVSEGPGKGSDFVVDLPRLLDTGEEAVTSGRRMSRPPSRPDADAAARRVLVVDDNTDAADTIADTLSELGYEVAIAYDGPSALVCAGQFRPNVCLLDIGLPVMDGYELARRFRDDDRMPEDLRLVAVTGYGQDADHQRSREAGFDAHVVKPVQLEQLIKIVSQRPEPRSPASG